MSQPFVIGQRLGERLDGKLLGDPDLMLFLSLLLSSSERRIQAFASTWSLVVSIRGAVHAAGPSRPQPGKNSSQMGMPFVATRRLHAQAAAPPPRRAGGPSGVWAKCLW